MKRRDFLQYSALLPFAGYLNNADALVGSQNKRVVVLVELAGGNDGLNTLVPYNDKVYQRLRPTLKLSKSQVTPIGQDMGMHPSLKPLLKHWNNKDLAWIQGVGYPHPDRSHFRSGDIWHTASNADQYLNTGWAARMFGNQRSGSNQLNGVVIGDNLGPMQGKSARTIAMKKPETFMQQAKLIDKVDHVSANKSLSHIIDIQHQLTGAKGLVEKCRHIRHLDRHFKAHPFHNDLKAVAKMIVGEVGASVYKVTLSGFDTHASQAQIHKNLLHYLADGLDSFASAMNSTGHWDNVLVMTYSEFGRRVEENLNGGTDHGAASVQLVMGGKVNGKRLHGQRPNLSHLDRHDGDLHHTTDFRSLYSTVAGRWLNKQNHWRGHREVRFV